MTNSQHLTEQWRNGTLERGYYYYLTKVGARVIGFQCYGLKYPYDYNHNTIDSVREVLAPVPDYMDCKRLMNDSIELDKAKIKIYELVSHSDELVQKIHILNEANMKLENTVGKLSKQLNDANKLIKWCMRSSWSGNQEEDDFDRYCKFWGVK